MKISKQIMGHVDTNTYYLELEDEMIVVDPCVDLSQSSIRLLKPTLNKNVIAVLITHGHFDHISGIDAVVAMHHCPVFVFNEEQHMLYSIHHNLSYMSSEPFIVDTPSETLKLGTKKIGKFNFEIIQTGGHTASSVSYVFDNDIICGDFIFKNSVGRMDLPTGSEALMKQSIIKFVKEYKDKNIYIYPGHGDITSLEDEIKTNSYIKKMI